MINQFRVRENGVVLPPDSPTMLFPGINTQTPLSPSGLTELAFALNAPGTSMMILRAPTTRLPSVDVSSLRFSPSTHSLLTSLRQEQGRKITQLEAGNKLRAGDLDDLDVVHPLGPCHLCRSCR